MSACAGDESASTMAPLEVMSPRSRGNDVDTRQMLASPAADVCSSPGEWIQNFTIPWSKCRQTLMESLHSKSVPASSDLRELISHTVSDIFTHTRRPTRKQLRCVAKMIVDRQPNSFADYINGQVVDDGVNSLMLMLESKKENLNRRVHSSGSSDGAPVSNKKRSTVSEESTIDNETISQYESMRKKLLEYFAQEKADTHEVDHAMLVTYPYQRFCINRCMAVNETLKKWPFLGTTKYLLLHAKYLTTVDIEQSLRRSIVERFEVVFSFLLKHSATAKNFSALVQTAPKPQQPLFLLQMVMCYFREDTGHLLQFVGVCRSHANDSSYTVNKADDLHVIMTLIIRRECLYSTHCEPCA